MSFPQQLMDGFAATWCPGRRSGLQWNCAGKARRSWKLVRLAYGNCFCTWFARRIHVRLEMLARNPRQFHLSLDIVYSARPAGNAQPGPQGAERMVAFRPERIPTQSVADVAAGEYYGSQCTVAKRFSFRGVSRRNCPGERNR